MPRPGVTWPRRRPTAGELRRCAGALLVAADELRERLGGEFVSWNPAGGDDSLDRGRLPLHLDQHIHAGIALQPRGGLAKVPDLDLPLDDMHRPIAQRLQQMPRVGADRQLDLLAQLVAVRRALGGSLPGEHDVHAALGVLVGSGSEHLVPQGQLPAAIVADVDHPAPGMPLGSRLTEAAAESLGILHDRLELQLPVECHRRMASSTCSVSDRSSKTACGPQAASSRD